MKGNYYKVGSTKPGFATVTLHRGSSTIIFREVPAEVCENCGEYFFSKVVLQ